MGLRMDYEQREEVAAVAQSFFVQKAVEISEGRYSDRLRIAKRVNLKTNPTLLLSKRSNPQLKTPNPFSEKWSPRRMRFYSIDLPKACLSTETRRNSNPAATI